MIRYYLLCVSSICILCGCGSILSLAMPDEEDDKETPSTPYSTPLPNDPEPDSSVTTPAPTPTPTPTPSPPIGGRRCSITQPFGAPIELDPAFDNFTSLRIPKSEKVGVASWANALHFVELSGYEVKTLGGSVIGGDGDGSHPTLTADGKVMVFERNNDLQIARRSSVGTNNTNGFDSPRLIEIDGAGMNFDFAREPFIVGSRLYYTRREMDQQRSDVWVANFDVERGRLTQNQKLANISTDQSEDHPVVAADELEIFYSVDDELPARRIYHAIRKSPAEPFQAGVRVPSPLSGPAENDNDEYPTWISSDGCELLLVSRRNGSTSLFRARRL
jgi:hypothetical protein